MADGPDYQAEFEAALKAAQQPQPAPGLTPPAPGLPDHQAELAAALAAPPTASSEPFGPPAPAAPYGFSNAAAHAYTLGLDEPARAAGMATGRYLAGKGFNYPEAAAQIQRGREAYGSEHPWANLGGSLLGGIANPINVLGGRAITNAATLPEKIGLSGGTGTLTGAVQGAAENTTSIDDMLRGARIGGEWGGAIGTAFPIAGKVGGALFPPLKPGVGDLRNVGVVPTPGQAAGGLFGAGESGFSHIPIVGQPIKAAREDARTQWQTALTKQADDLQTAVANQQGPGFVRGAINEPLAVIGETSSPTAVTGHEMVADMKAKLKTAFSNAVPTAGGLFDATADTAINDAVANAKLTLSGRELNDFNKFVQDRIIGKVGTSGALSGPDFQDLDQALGDKAHRFLKSADPYHNEAGKAYLDLQEKMRDWLERVSPTNATDLKNANLAWRTAKPIENAARSTNDPEGFFTIANLRSGARSANPSKFVTGAAPMQQFANNADLARTNLTAAGDLARTNLTAAGTSVLGKPPGLGGQTGDIAGLAGTGIGLGPTLFEHPELLKSPWLWGPILGGYGAAKAAYSEPGRKALTGLLGALGTVPPAMAPYGPLAGQVAPGLLTGLGYNRQTQP